MTDDGGNYNNYTVCDDKHKSATITLVCLLMHAHATYIRSIFSTTNVEEAMYSPQTYLMNYFLK